MKKSLFAIFCALCLLLGACASHTTQRGVELASQGKTSLEFSGFDSDAKELHSCLLAALQERRWAVLDSGNPVKAEIHNADQHASVSIKVEDDKLVFDTKGSFLDVKGPYVPLRYIDYLMQSVRRNLHERHKVKVPAPAKAS